MKQSIMPPVETRKSLRRPNLSTKKPEMELDRVLGETTLAELTHGGGDDHVPDIQNSVDDKLSVLVGDTDIGEYTIDVVGHESISRPLGEETSRKQNEKPVAVALGLEQLEPTSLFCLLLDSNSLSDLIVFKLNNLVIGIPLSVDLCKNRKSLLGLALGNVPTWRFGDQPDAGDLEDGRESLDNGRNAP
jgi:hypothetical protein